MPTAQAQGTNVPVVEQSFDVQSTANERAEILARWFNVKEYKSSVIFVGMLQWPNGVALDSATVITIINKGLFNGNWIIRTVKQELNEGKLNTSIILRKCLNPEDYPILSAQVGSLPVD